MNLIQYNPYRVAGVLSDSTARELVRQKNKISKSAAIGRHVDSEMDFPFMDSVDRTDIDIVNKAFSQLEQNQDKVRNALFWFVKANSFDETAINYLIIGQKDKALEIWSKVTNGKEVTSRNYSSFNNIGTLKLLGNTAQEIKEGIEAKIKMIESPDFETFVHSVADQTYTINKRILVEEFIDDVLKQINGKYTNAQIINLFSGSNDVAKSYLIQKFTEEPLHNIEKQIDYTKNKRKTNKSVAYDFGLKLYLNSKNDLISLKSMLGAGDLKYKMIADGLANEIMQCGIDYFQKWKESKNPSEEGLKLLKYAQSIAVGTQTKDRIKENINAIQDWAKIATVRNEYEFIIEKLIAFKILKDTISNAKELVDLCKPKLLAIKAQLGIHNEEYLNLSSAIANNALGMIIKVINEEQNSPLIKFGDFYSLKIVIRQGLAVLKEIVDLDMKSEQRKHVGENYSTLKSMALQLGISLETKAKASPISKAENETSATTNYPPSKSEGYDLDIAILILIIFVAFVLFLSLS